jgi:hypothetical protein
MLRGSSPGEENLTFLLCELLDESSSGLHLLQYSLAQAKQDLEKSDAGVTVGISFETHEHTKHFESRYSGADLGVVLSIDHPVLGRSRRAVLLQAKRLFPPGRSTDYSIYSAYSSYDARQAEFLKALATRFGIWNSTFYLWYNPASHGFREPEARVIRAYEAHGGRFAAYPYRNHPFLDELLDMGYPLGVGSQRALGPPDPEQEERIREWRVRQPALRVSSLDAVLSVADRRSAPQLKGFYDALVARHDDMTFAPLADFLLLALASSRYGSDNADWIKLAEGAKVGVPPLKKDRGTTGDDSLDGLDGLDQVPTPRHTLRIAVSSTLPQIG